MIVQTAPTMIYPERREPKERWLDRAAKAASGLLVSRARYRPLRFRPFLRRVHEEEKAWEGVGREALREAAETLAVALRKEGFRDPLVARSFVITARATDEDGTYTPESLLVEVTEPGGGAPVTGGMGILAEPEDTATVVVQPEGASSGEAGAPAGETVIAPAVITESTPVPETPALSTMAEASEAAALYREEFAIAPRAGDLPAPLLRGESPWAEAADSPRPWELSGDRFKPLGKTGVLEAGRGDSLQKESRFAWRARNEDSFWSGKDSSRRDRQEKPWVRRFVGQMDEESLGPNAGVKVQLPGERPPKERAVPAWRRWIRK